jgi:hypothetical protein
MASPVAGAAVEAFALDNFVPAIAEANGLAGAVGPANLAADALVVDEIHFRAFRKLRRGLGVGLWRGKVSQQRRRGHSSTGEHKVSSGYSGSCVFHNHSSFSSGTSGKAGGFTVEGTFKRPYGKRRKNGNYTISLFS